MQEASVRLTAANITVRGSRSRAQHSSVMMSKEIVRVGYVLRGSGNFAVVSRIGHWHFSWGLDEAYRIDYLGKAVGWYVYHVLLQYDRARGDVGATSMVAR